MGILSRENLRITRRHPRVARIPPYIGPHGPSQVCPGDIDNTDQLVLVLEPGRQPDVHSDGVVDAAMGLSIYHPSLCSTTARLGQSGRTSCVAPSRRGAPPSMVDRSVTGAASYRPLPVLCRVCRVRVQPHFRIRHSASFPPHDRFPHLSAFLLLANMKSTSFRLG
jgi:hypothetical protein